MVQWWKPSRGGEGENIDSLGDGGNMLRTVCGVD
jgi:hypothetical protein